VTLRKDKTEYPVNPQEVAEALAAEIPPETLDTGVIDSNVLRVWKRGSKLVVIGWRKPQITGIWLEGSEQPLRVPLPGLLMARIYTGGTRASYHVAAINRRPENPKSNLYEVPLPNVNRGVCWGTVQLPDEAALMSSSLEMDWQQLLGSQFGNHSVSGKCKAHPGDIRKLFLQLHEAGAKRYPAKELLPAKSTFGAFMNSACNE
jgi:hypothetical protein